MRMKRRKKNIKIYCKDKLNNGEDEDVEEEDEDYDEEEEI